jgi:glycosyltransferase involved in cell wall biosynthesis
MRVLLVSQYFAPELGATQNRMMEFTQALVRAQHQVDVLTEVPNHPSGVILPAFRRRWIHVERAAGYTVTRVWVAAATRKTFRTRLTFYFSFVVMALAASFRLPSRYDVVIATSPPLPAALAGLIISRVKRAAFVLDVRDLWPHAAIALGELGPGLIYRLAEYAETRLYRGAALITATTSEFCRYIINRGVPASRVRQVPNGTRPDIFRPDHPGRDAFRAARQLTQHFVVLYAGLHGIAQDLPSVLGAAGRLIAEQDMVFLFIGEGPMKASLLETAAQRGLRNVRFLSELPLEDCAAALAAADVLLVPLSANKVFDMFIPSKLFDAMAAARPIVLSVDGEARAILERAGAGLFVPPGDDRALASALLRLRANPDDCRDMGARGRQFVLDRYDRRREADAFVAAVESAVQGTR